MATKARELKSVADRIGGLRERINEVDDEVLDAGLGLDPSAIRTLLIGAGIVAGQYVAWLLLDEKE